MSVESETPIGVGGAGAIEFAQPHSRARQRLAGGGIDYDAGYDASVLFRIIADEYGGR
jgi:hypothetical protein